MLSVPSIGSFLIPNLSYEFALGYYLKNKQTYVLKIQISKAKHKDLPVIFIS